MADDISNAVKNAAVAGDVAMLKALVAACTWGGSYRCELSK